MSSNPKSQSKCGKKGYKEALNILFKLQSWTCVCVHSRVWLFATSRTAAFQASLSLEFSRQQYWSEFPFPTPGDLLNPRIKLTSPILASGSSNLRRVINWEIGIDVYTLLYVKGGFPGGSDGEEPACNAGDLGSIPGSERSPGEGNGNPLQYSCLENPRDRGTWQTIVHRVAKSQRQLSD